MASIADDMLSGVLCAMCGVSLDCDECSKLDIPMYCSVTCARDAGEDPQDRICNHNH